MAPRAPHFWYFFVPKKVQIKLIELAGLERGAPARGLGRNIPNRLFPNCVSTVPDATLSEAEHPGLEGPLRKGATVQKQCGPASRVNGQRKGWPGPGPLQKHPQLLFPFCVSTVFDETLSEAEPPGLEGP